jgi:hypothetical protein
MGRLLDANPGGGFGFGGGGGGGGNPIGNTSSLIPGVGGLNPTGDNTTIQQFDPNLKTPNITTGTGLGGDIFTGTPNVFGAGSIPPAINTNVGATTIPIPPTTTTATMPGGFPANVGSTIPGTGIQNLDIGSLLGVTGGSDFTNIFGGQVGSTLQNFLQTGGYSPQIAQALINQMSPLEERTRNQILESFGAAGGRYGSPAQIGLADYESSFSLGQQGILANLANNAINRSFGLFGETLPFAAAEQANKLSPFDILSNLLKALSGLKGGGGSSGGGGGTGAGGSNLPIHLPGGGTIDIGGLGIPPSLSSSTPPAGTDLINQILQGINAAPPNFDPSQSIGGGIGTVSAGPPSGIGQSTIIDPTTGLPIDTTSGLDINQFGPLPGSTAGSGFDTTSFTDPFGSGGIFDPFASGGAGDFFGTGG